jgi:cytochrome P450
LALLTLVVVYVLAQYVYPVLNRSWRAKTKGLGPFTTLWHLQSRKLHQKIDALNISRGFYHLWFGPRFSLIAADPDAAQFVIKCPQLQKGTNFSSPLVKEKFGSNIVFVNGDDWRRHRLFVNSGFTGTAYHSYYQTFQEVNSKLLNKWASLPKGEDLDCSMWLSKFTLDLLGQSIFHYDFENLNTTQNPYYEAYSTILSNGGFLHRFLIMLCPYLDYLPIPGSIRIKQAMEKMTDLFNSVIKEHKSKNSGDILDKLLEGFEKDTQLSKEELFSNIWIFFVAGHETTATALSWALVELADKQDIQEKLFNEVTKHYANNIPSFEQLYPKPIEYLECFIQENLRVHPPVTLLPTRVATTDVVYENQLIPQGSMVGIDIRSIHNHPDFWEEPEKFDPERFSPERRKGRHKFAFLPFSLGNRQCIGNEFSEIEQRLFLVTLLQRYKILPPKNHPPLDLTELISFGNRFPIYIRLEERKQ